MLTIVSARTIFARGGTMGRHLYPTIACDASTVTMVTTKSYASAARNPNIIAGAAMPATTAVSAAYPPVARYATGTPRRSRRQPIVKRLRRRFAVERPETASLIMEALDGALEGHRVLHMSPGESLTLASALLSPRHNNGSSSGSSGDCEGMGGLGLGEGEGGGGGGGVGGGGGGASEVVAIIDPAATPSTSPGLYASCAALSARSGGRFRAYPGKIESLDLEDGCPPTSELIPGQSTRAWSDQTVPVSLIGLMDCTHGLRFVLTWLYRLGMRTGPFHFGRSRFHVLMPHVFARQVVAQPGDAEYGRVAVLAGVLAHVRETLSLPLSAFEVQRQQKGPEKWSYGPCNMAGDMSMLSFEPRVSSGLEDWEGIHDLDRIVRLLFVQRTRGLSRALPLLGPGAAKLQARAGVTGSPVVKDMAPADFVAIANAFVEWENRPAAWGAPLEAGRAAEWDDPAFESIRGGGGGGSGSGSGVDDDGVSASGGGGGEG